MPQDTNPLSGVTEKLKKLKGGASKAYSLTVPEIIQDAITDQIKMAKRAYQNKVDMAKATLPPFVRYGLEKLMKRKTKESEKPEEPAPSEPQDDEEDDEDYLAEIMQDGFDRTNDNLNNIFEVLNGGVAFEPNVTEDQSPKLVDVNGNAFSNDEKADQSPKLINVNGSVISDLNDIESATEKSNEVLGDIEAATEETNKVIESVNKSITQTNKVLKAIEANTKPDELDEKAKELEEDRKRRAGLIRPLDGGKDGKKGSAIIDAIKGELLNSVLGGAAGAGLFGALSGKIKSVITGGKNLVKGGFSKLGGFGKSAVGGIASAGKYGASALKGLASSGVVGRGLSFLGRGKGAIGALAAGATTYIGQRMFNKPTPTITPSVTEEPTTAPKRVYARDAKGRFVSTKSAVAPVSEAPVETAPRVLARDAKGRFVSTKSAVAPMAEAAEIGGKGVMATAKGIGKKMMGTPLTLALSGVDAYGVSQDDTLTDAQKKKEYVGIAGGAAGSIAGGVAGAQLGAALGLATGPLAPIASPLLAMAFGAAGYFGGRAVGDAVGDAIFGDKPKEEAPKIASPAKYLSPASSLDYGVVANGSKFNRLKGLTNQIDELNEAKQIITNTVNAPTVNISNPNGSQQQVQASPVGIPAVRNNDGTIQRLLDSNFSPMFK